MYKIKIDRAHNLIAVALSGMMSAAEVADYIGELRTSFIRAHFHSGYTMVIDVSNCPIQQQDTLRAFGAHMATMPKARAIAIVTGSSLARMQIRRLFTQPYARIVATPEEARAWVISGTEPSPETDVVATPSQVPA